MSYIAPEIIAEVKQMDLLTYLKTCEPQELVHFSGNTYTTKSHDSLKISNGKWCWWSQHIGGRSALDYLIKVRGFSFLEAIQMLADQVPTIPIAVPEERPEPKKLLLSPANRDCNRARAYLKMRGIEEPIINYCIETGRLYESRDYHNAVFVGMNRDMEPKYAAIRGTNSSNYKGEASGSDKHYAFSIPAQESSQQLHLFESAIDLLSYATLQSVGRCHWNEDHLLSLAGVYQSKKNLKDWVLPVALSQYLTDYPEIKKITLHLDNDRAGREASAAIIQMLSDKYLLADEPPNQGKDVNEFLCMQLGISSRQLPERSKERA